MFFSKNRDLSRYVDNIFPVTNACKNDSDPRTINGTIGSLYNEEGVIAAYKTVYDGFRSLSNETLTRYAESSFGNAAYNEAIEKFVLEGRVKNHKSIPTAGGTGGISLAMNVCLDEGDTILIPEIAWGNYRTIAREFKLNVLTYDIYDLDDIFGKIDQLEKVFLIINSPCHNPCGLSYSFDEWKAIIAKLNDSGKEAVILNDVAYIDYTYGDDYKDYFGLFNSLNDNVLVIIAYSCSKAFSYYGVRLGSLLAIHNDTDFLELFINQCARRTRSTISSVNNGAMENLTNIINEHLDEYLAEKETYKKLLKERSDIFVRECAECGLEHYPYHDGFFVTLKFDDNGRRDEVFERFLADHVYCIKVNKGIRVGICAIPVEKVRGLAARLKALC